MTSLAFPRTLHRGDTGDDVTALKRALVKWNKGQPDGVVITPHLGDAAVALLRDFQQAERLQQDGIAGPNTETKLAAFVDDYGHSLLDHEAALLAQAARPRNRFLQIADQSVLHVAVFDYTMRLGDGPGDRGWFRVSPLDWKPRKTCDCSQHYIACGHHAGLKHPIMNSDGATGELLRLDHITLAEAEAGDGVIWVGPNHPEGVHITILRAKLPTGDWRTVNMGTEGQPAYTTLSGEQQIHAEGGNPTQVVVRLPE